eukprot:4869644-Pyramimonas_sp.AAC.1
MHGYAFDFVSALLLLRCAMQCYAFALVVALFLLCFHALLCLGCLDASGLPLLCSSPCLDRFAVAQNMHT